MFNVFTFITIQNNKHSMLSNSFHDIISNVIVNSILEKESS